MPYPSGEGWRFCSCITNDCFILKGYCRNCWEPSDAIWRWFWEPWVDKGDGLWNLLEDLEIENATCIQIKKIPNTDPPSARVKHRNERIFRVFLIRWTFIVWSLASITLSLLIPLFVSKRLCDNPTLLQRPLPVLHSCNSSDTVVSEQGETLVYWTQCWQMDALVHGS